MPGLSWAEIHGALTHFPVALLLTAVVFEIGAAALHKPAGRLISFWLLAGAVAMAVPALLTGWVTGSQLFSGSAHPPGVFLWHRAFAFITSGLAIALLLWRVLTRDRLAGTALSGSVLLLLIVGGAVGCTGYLGGRMVFSGQARGGDEHGDAKRSTESGEGSIRPTRLSTTDQPKPTLQKVEAGRALFQRLNCLSCHRMKGTGGTAGPDLTNEGSRRSDVRWQIDHLKNPEKMTPGTMMPGFSHLSPGELEALASFLTTRK